MTEPLSLFSLPLFPLGTVLYPGGTLPLRIFEVRYLDMVRKCHRSGAPFGVVLLTRGSEVTKASADAATAPGSASETFCPVGTLATITQCEAPQPGLLVVRCTGTRRFRITRSEKLKHGLWIGDVTLQPTDQAVPIPDDLAHVSQALNALIQSLHQRAVPVPEMPVQAPYLLDDCAWVANRWCELLPIPVEHKQRLMELDNPLVRLELVSDVLEGAGISG
ncbi:MAG: LON peptidase substrate-binding domain-containing protein [Rhodoferax sp.]|nr:LON peptidase substrate-binding domain-containing protein [Rhodoferax sp.]